VRKAYILVGPPGSGKSTYTSTLGDVDVFSLDRCREAVLDRHRPEITDPKERYANAFDICVHDCKEEFDQLVNERWTECLRSSKDVVVDNTNLTRKSRARWVNDLHARKFHVVMVMFMVTLQTVQDRQSTRRDKEVPADVVRDMYMRLQEPLSTEYDELVFV